MRWALVRPLGTSFGPPKRGQQVPGFGSPLEAQVIVVDGVVRTEIDDHFERRDRLRQQILLVVDNPERVPDLGALGSLPCEIRASCRAMSRLPPEWA
jgi:hypothetical protein